MKDSRCAGLLIMAPGSLTQDCHPSGWQHNTAMFHQCLCLTRSPQDYSDILHRVFTAQYRHFAVEFGDQAGER